MGQFIFRRLVIAVFVSLTVSVIGFSLLRFSGDLAHQLAGDDARPAQVADVAHRYGLDRPLYVQYVDWAGNALTGNLGRSLFTNEPVSELIGERIGVTLKLAIFSILFAAVIGVTLGVVAAVRANSAIDRGALALAVFGQAIPNFWFGLILIVVFGVTLHWLPISGSDSLLNFVLPTVTLGFTVMPPFMRLTRSGMLDVLNADYIRTARAKGLLPHTVIFKHALRNAILPVVSLLAVTFGFLLGGSVIVESVFALNGIGLLAFQSIVRADFPVVQAIIVFVSFAYIGLTLLADIVNAWLDPRIRLA
jgi:ABC-type dipeptide/oligopeptide/nickel transport system permease component